MSRFSRYAFTLLLTSVLATSALPPAAQSLPAAGGPVSVIPAESSARAEWIAGDESEKDRLPGLNCRPRRTPLKCDIYAKYRNWLAYLKYVGKPNPDARWKKREARYLRNHKKVEKRLGPTGIFRHPGKRAFDKKVRTRRDRRDKGIPAEAFTKGGGPNYCTTLTISRLIESRFFRSDQFTAHHKVRWCWDDNVVYNQGHGNWTEIVVHDGLAVGNEGQIAKHNGSLPTSGEWYSSQQWSICNCAFRLGVLGHWQPLWQVWAEPGGEYSWEAHW